MPMIGISSDNYPRESYSPEKNAQPSVAVLPRVNEQADHQKPSDRSHYHLPFRVSSQVPGQ